MALFDLYRFQGITTFFLCWETRYFVINFHQPLKKKLTLHFKPRDSINLNSELRVMVAVSQQGLNETGPRRGLWERWDWDVGPWPICKWINAQRSLTYLFIYSIFSVLCNYMLFNAFRWPELNWIHRENEAWPQIILTSDFDWSVLLFKSFR